MFSIIGIGFVTSLVIGGGNAFAATAGVAANPASGETNILATLNPPATVVNPSVPGGEKPHKPTGNFGIAYNPGTFGFTGELKSGAMSLPEYSGNPTRHVGVKDTTFSDKGWNLTATLTWTNPIDGASVNMSVGSVQENTNDGTTAFDPSDFVTPSITGAFITPTSTVELLNGTPTNIINAQDNFVYSGTYDVGLSNISLEIADGSKVAAGTHTGTVNWNLGLNP